MKRNEPNPSIDDPAFCDTDSELHCAVEVMAMMPKLRDDLRISVQNHAGQTCYVIEDAMTSKFFRLGIAEYTLVSMLDGKTTIAEAMGQTASVSGDAALCERETGTLIKWMIDSGLASTDQSRGAGRLSDAANQKTQQHRWAKANPVMQKAPLLNPMPLLKPLDGLSRFVFSRLGAAIWLVVVILGGYCIGSRAIEFGSASSSVLASGNWMWLAATWVGLKVIHECGHAMACRRYRGNVREAGIVFILFMPMPYVDVTSIWRLDSKWSRIWVSAAGMYAELFVAAVAGIVWANSFDPLIQQHCVNLIITASVVTLLFNANPLMRFDGYYILADAIEMPNLATHGRQWIAYAVRRYFLGLAVKCPQWPEGKHSVVVAYAIASFLWRVVITVSIALSAEILFHGAGVAIAFAALAMAIAPGVMRAGKTIRESSHVNYRRMASITGGALATAWLLWAMVPWYSQSNVPVIVDFHAAQEYRCGVSGFLVTQNVSVGDRVRRGDVLAKLANRELELDYENLLIDFQQSVQRSRSFRAEGEIAAAQIEDRSRQAVQERMDEVKRQLDSLCVYANTDGVVTTCDMESRIGMALTAGERLLVVGNHASEIVYGLIDQAEIDAFRGTAGTPIDVHIWGRNAFGGDVLATGRQTFEGKISQVLPRATTQLRHPALGAHAGGPISVRPAAKDVSTQSLSVSNREDESNLELVQPHFVVLVDFAGCAAEGVLPGQTGYARLRYRSGTVGQVAVGALKHWIDQKRQLLSPVHAVSQAVQGEQQKCQQIQFPRLLGLSRS